MKNKTIIQYYKYLKKDLLFIVFMFFLVLGTTFLSVFFINSEFPAFRLLYLFSRWNFYFCTIMATIAYYLFTVALRAQCAETIDSICKKKHIWQRKVGICFGTIWILYHLFLIGMFLYCVLRNDATNYFLTFFPRAYLMNIMIPQVIFIGVAYISSYMAKNNKVMSLSVLVFFFMITSPLLEKLIWRVRPVGIPIDQIINKIKWLFSILYQNAEWSPDTQYGLQTENVRLYLQMFWLLLIVGVIFWEHNKKKLVSGICISASIILLIASFSPTSLYRQNESWDGIFADLEYYSESEMIPENENKLNYSFSKYDLDVEIKNQLNVTGKLMLSSKKTQREFVFTLYHGYRVKQLLASGYHLSYIQEGDRVTITFDQPVKQAEIKIVYEGSSGKYYSNSQGIMLPGYFPWYPMAGEKKVFVQYDNYNGGNGYNPYNRIAESDVKIHIDTQCDYITNLEKKNNGYYLGKSDGITIIGGNLIQTQEQSFQNILPLELIGTNQETYLKNMNQRWEQLLENLKNVYGLDIEKLKTKKIILCSKDIGRNFSNNFFVEFNDYLLVVDEYMDSGSYINYLLHQKMKNSRIGELLSNAVMLYETTSAQDVIDKMIEAESNHATMLNELEGKEMQLPITEQLQKIQKEISSEQLLKSMVQYLLNDEISSDQQFFESLY